MTNKWLLEWPTKEGNYWFYGKRYSSSDEKEVYFVKVMKTPYSLVAVCEGAFLYRAEGAEGVWQPAIIPELPEGEVLTSSR